MKYFEFTFIFFFLHLSVFPQADFNAQKEKSEDSVNVKRFSIKFNFFQWVLTREARLLTEKYFNNNNSFELITSYYSNYFPLGGRNPDFYSYRSGYKIGIGYRHYYKNDFYINLLFFYKYMANTNVRGFVEGARWPGESDDNIYYYNYISNIYSFQLQAGRIFIVKKILADGYTGIGIRLRKDVGAVVQRCNSLAECWYPYESYSNNLFIPTIHLGVNLGYIK